MKPNPPNNASNLTPGMRVFVPYKRSFYPATVIRYEAMSGDDYVLVRWEKSPARDYKPTCTVHIDDVRVSWAIPSAGRG
jgi:hypothetical protein